MVTDVVRLFATIEDIYLTHDLNKILYVKKRNIFGTNFVDEVCCAKMVTRVKALQRHSFEVEK